MNFTNQRETGQAQFHLEDRLFRRPPQGPPISLGLPSRSINKGQRGWDLGPVQRPSHFWRGAGPPKALPCNTIAERHGSPPATPDMTRLPGTAMEKRDVIARERQKEDRRVRKRRESQMRAWKPAQENGCSPSGSSIRASFAHMTSARLKTSDGIFLTEVGGRTHRNSCLAHPNTSKSRQGNQPQ